MQAKIVARKGKNNRLLTQVTPFAGRNWCVNVVIDKIFANCDPNHTHFVWLDNGDQTEKLLTTLKERAKNFTLIVDDSPQVNITTDTVNDANVLNALAQKIYYTYQFCFSQIGNSKLTWVIEDDVEIPTNCLTKLQKSLENDLIGTVVGRMIDRRPHIFGLHKTVVQEYTVTKTLGTFETTRVVAKQLDADLPNSIPPKIGTQLVGSAHMGCWLTKTNLLKDVGIALIDDGCLCVDNNWGWRLYKTTGKRVLIDWSVHCRHHYLHDGVHKIAE